MLNQVNPQKNFIWVFIIFFLTFGLNTTDVTAEDTQKRIQEILDYQDH